MKQLKNKKIYSLYHLQKITNSVVKWTSIITFFCLDYIKQKETD
jgi:hypothetical protein